MKHLITILIAACLFATSAMAGSTDYATQRSTQEQSYRDKMADQALQEHYRNNPVQTPAASTSNKRKARKNSDDLHRKTFGNKDTSEVWGTK